MKIKILIPVLLLLSTYLGAQESASVVMKKAYEQASKENKKVFLIFHASWCSWCKKMEQKMADPSCKDFFEKNYVIVHLDVLERQGNKQLENPGAFDLLKKYNGDKSGIPFFLIFDKDGKLLEDSFDANSQNLGCPASKEEVDEFVRMLKATSALNDEELQVIYNLFLIKK